jgi:hypothetical protein
LFQYGEFVVYGPYMTRELSVGVFVRFFLGFSTNGCTFSKSTASCVLHLVWWYGRRKEDSRVKQVWECCTLNDMAVKRDL